MFEPGQQEIIIPDIYDKSRSGRQLMSLESFTADDDLVGTNLSKSEDDLLWKHVSSVRSRDAEFHHLYSKSISTHSKRVKLELIKYMNLMMQIDEAFSVFLDQPTHHFYDCRNKDPVTGECIDKFVPTDFDCLRGMMAVYESECEKFTDYSRKYIKFLVRECEQPSMERNLALSKLKDACHH
jgi:hypothetical protein